MTATQTVVGADVSKATLAVCHQVGAHVQHLEVANTPAGFRQLVRCGGAASLYVLEATGPCYLAVAYHLVAAGAQVAVLNPLVVKRFIQIHLGKSKSDRKDAQWLLRYGQQQVRWSSKNSQCEVLSSTAHAQQQQSERLAVDPQKIYVRLQSRVRAPSGRWGPANRHGPRLEPITRFARPLAAPGVSRGRAQQCRARGIGAR